jgi:hypothetical protein
MEAMFQFQTIASTQVYSGFRVYFRFQFWKKYFLKTAEEKKNISNPSKQSTINIYKGRAAYLLPSVAPPKECPST